MNILRNLLKSKAFKSGYAVGQDDKATGRFTVFLSSDYQTELQAGYNAARGVKVAL